MKGRPLTIISTDITDVDGDKISVKRSDRGTGHARVTTSSRSGAELAPDQVDKLIEALKPYGTQTTPAAPELVVGREYRLLPGAKYCNGAPIAWGVYGAARVKLNSLRDCDGDVSVTLLDGEQVGDVGWYVSPAYLAPIDPVGAVPSFGDPVPEPKLNPLRVAALEKSSEILGEFHVDTHGDVPVSEGIHKLARFLLDEEAR